MKPEQYIERNIKKVLEEADRTERPTVSSLQRVCRIGYNQATHTLEEMERQGIVSRSHDEPWKWQWTN